MCTVLAHTTMPQEFQFCGHHLIWSTSTTACTQSLLQYYYNCSLIKLVCKYIALADSIDTKLTLQYYTVTLKLIKVAQSGWTQKAKLPLIERSHQIVEADPVTIQKQTLFKNMTKSQKYFMHDSSGFNLSRYDITLWPRDKVTVTKTCIKCALSGDYNCKACKILAGPIAAAEKQPCWDVWTWFSSSKPY